MALADIFVAAFTSILKFLLLTALGSLLAIGRVDILGEEARRHLNNVVFFVFYPALVVSYLAKSITYNSLTMLWFMPLNILITFVIGSVLGWMLIRVTGAPIHLQGLVLGCCAAGNLVSMPLIIVPAVCKERGSPFSADRNCNTNGMAYVSLSMAIGSIYMWSYVYNLVRIYLSRIPEVSDSTEDLKSRRALLSLEAVSTTTEEDHSNLDLPMTDQEEKVCFAFSAKSQLADRIKQFLKIMLVNLNPRRMIAPSTIGAVVGFIIGTVPQVRNAIVGDRAPLRVIQDSASLLGDAAIPTVSLIMGANLLKGLKGSKVQLQVLIGILAIRYIALPLSGTVIVRGAVHFGLVRPDPLYQFVLLLQYAVPPAVSIGTMTQLFGVGEEECSVILLWSYVSASVSLTLWSAFFMWLVG